MKDLKPTRIAYILLLVFATFSCEKSDNETFQENKNGELAVFTFSNGSTLKFIESDEEGDPAVTAVELVPEESKDFIDFDNNSMLEIYLALTPEKHPGPKVLVTFSGSKKGSALLLLQKRQVVSHLDQPIDIQIKELPKTILKPRLTYRGYCDNTISSHADYCVSDKWQAGHDIRETKYKYRNTKSVTEVFSDSEQDEVLLRHFYQKSNGKWKWRKGAGVVYPKGYILTAVDHAWSKRRRRIVRMGRTICCYKLYHWRGWVDFFS